MHIANLIYDTVFKYLMRHAHRTEVEDLLQIFDQGRMGDDRHLLEIDEAEIPERYRPILRRLQRAVVEPEMAEAMDLEDEVLEELQSRERDIARERAEKEKETRRAEKEKARAEEERWRAASIYIAGVTITA